MSGKHGRKPGQMADKVKQGMKDQGQRMENDMDRMADEARRDRDRLGAGMKKDAQQGRADMKEMSKDAKRKLQHH
ncbi:hypothetical protein D7D52_26320 [Nocardia yunnanensis]|uniref:Uncharacterized protein n=1 Tax=Nocardia yunnanensis TaxID=2382165 RepID=A0A386ZHZ3_9NOCA|nr:hypothetical protein [Nocardia yunnanensis]AYF76744.1 hypothetical protein D7D52_26320 [Nocardia yunnanensis]